MDRDLFDQRVHEAKLIEKSAKHVKYHYWNEYELIMPDGKRQLWRLAAKQTTYRAGEMIDENGKDLVGQEFIGDYPYRVY